MYTVYYFKDLSETTGIRIMRNRSQITQIRLYRISDARWTNVQPSHTNTNSAQTPCAWCVPRSSAFFGTFISNSCSITRYKRKKNLNLANGNLGGPLGARAGAAIVL